MIVATLLQEARAVAVTTLSSRQFNQDTGRAKRAAKKGPVFITDRGRPALVLLTIEEYEKLSGNGQSLLEALKVPKEEYFDFEFPRLGGELVRPAEFD
jgi:prevent-host-death family protein